MVGKWRRIYVVTAMIAEYLNVFVLVVQAFEKAPRSMRWRPPNRSRLSWWPSWW
jgi:hypothetical protein